MWAPHVIRLTTITLRHFSAGERAPSTTQKSIIVYSMAPLLAVPSRGWTKVLNSLVLEELRALAKPEAREGSISGTKSQATGC
jgi:hypothetical protein